MVLEVRLHTTTVVVVDGCSVLSLVLFRGIRGARCIDVNHHNHNYYYVPNNDSMCCGELL